VCAYYKGAHIDIRLTWYNCEGVGQL